MTWPLVLISLVSLLFQAIRLFLSRRVVSASHSTCLPKGPSTTQWLMRSPVRVTDFTSFMKWGKFSKFAQVSYTVSMPAPTMMVLVV